ncbi:MAG: hypothetical protein WA783_18115 [Phormidesmis sp.]
MSTSVLPQLIAVDSELSEQVVTLAAQLNELQEKRKGIQTVIAMFESGATPEEADLTAATSVASPAKTSKTASQTAAKSATKSVTKTPAKATKTAIKRKKKTATATATTAAAKTEAAPEVATKTAAKTPKAKATRGRPAKAKETKSVAEEKPQIPATKRSGRTANWQRYVQESYRKAPLPDVIVGVLQAQPTNVFKIADVMNVVFKEDMPKNHFLKARNRISNILSAGARDGVWYRGRGGTYSMSEKAIKVS